MSLNIVYCNHRLASNLEGIGCVLSVRFSYSEGKLLVKIFSRQIYKKVAFLNQIGYTITCKLVAECSSVVELLGSGFESHLSVSTSLITEVGSRSRGVSPMAMTLIIRSRS